MASGVLDAWAVTGAGAAIGLLLAAPLAGAAESAIGRLETSISELDEFVIVGSRRQEGRSAWESLVPVDIVDQDELRNQGATDMDALLAAAIPSYNVDQQSINDAATLVRPARMRGLPPDSMLTLVNGKRRHRSAVIAFLGNGVADGAHGPDLAAIPAIAVKRVEVLRDGAAAQYGSDAIAGVVNFELRDDADSRELDVRYGEHYEGDGRVLNVAGNLGLPLTQTGFANISVEYRVAEGTDRSQQRSDAQALIDGGNPFIGDPGYARVFHPNVMVWGAPEIDYDVKLFGNLGIDLGNGREAYAFGNYSQREAEGGFYYRNPHTRSGIFRGPRTTVGSERYDTVKVADLSADGVSGNCPPIRIVGHAALADDIAAVEANPDCFSFISVFPGGFTPRFGGTVTDLGAGFGLRGRLAGEWRFDLSAVVGTNDVDFFINNTVNPQLLARLAHGRRASIPTDYRPGSYNETDATVNVDVLRPLYAPMFFSPVNVALGVEVRREQFRVESGDENSWFIDHRPGGLAEQGFGIGSNGFTGFGPRLAGEFSRLSRAAYVDLETDVVRNLTVALAGRHEYHEDIGETQDGKVAVRWSPTGGFGIRAAASTGFRAPTVGQANVMNVTTAFTGGQLADEATLPPRHPAARVVGARPLRPEESTNTSAGVVLAIGKLDVTLDYFRIAAVDRIARSSERLLAEADIARLLAEGIDDATSFSSVRFYTSNFDTTTRGVDLSATWSTDAAGGRIRVTLRGNWTETDVDARDPDVINDKRLVQIEENTPATRYVLSASHERGPLRVLLRARHYGGFVEFSTDDASARLDAEPRLLGDVELAWRVGNRLTLIAGAANVLDEYPTRQVANVSGLLYAETAPYGPNGGFHYLRIVWGR